MTPASRRRKTNQPDLMKQHPFSLGVLTDNNDGIGPVTRALVQACVRELATITGRTPLQVLQADRERSEGELTRKTDLDQLDAMLDALSEGKYADPVPVSTGRQAPAPSDEEGNDEGQSEAEQPVDAGAIGSARSRKLQAARATSEMSRWNAGSHT